MQSFDDILKGKEAPVVEQPQPETKEVEATTPETAEARAQRERDEKGRFVAKQEAETPAQPEPQKAEPPKVDKKAEPTPAEKPKETKQDDAEQRVPIKAVQEERRKRQELERRLAEYEARQRQPAPKIDPLQDPEGFANRIAQEAEARAWDRILNFSEASARRTYGEELVTEARDAFLEEMQANPGLYMALQQQPDPYDFVVKRHKREKFMREVQDPDEWTKQQREAIRRELETEYAQKIQQQPSRPAPVAPPPSLAAAPSTGRVTTTPKSWDGPTPLQSILRR